jgi:5-methylcytosine-specific restriction endonuclease McrA
MANLPNKFRPKSSGAKKFAPKKKYNSQEWLEYRSKFLKHNPKCYACGEDSSVVDHVKAWKKDEKLYYKEDNLIPLCSPCHSTVTQLFDRFAEPLTESKLKWLQTKRLDTGTSIRPKVVPWDRGVKNESLVFE